MSVKPSKDCADVSAGATGRRVVVIGAEADSFLRTAVGQELVEVTAANEMLTQMERFDGLSHLFHQSDATAGSLPPRRFTLKIKFDFLKPEQRWTLFLAQATRFNRVHAAGFRAALDALHNLTPGDFATVRRQASLSVSP